MTTDLPKHVSLNWLESKRSQLGMTVETLTDGSPNPHKAKLAAEVADAEAELARWQAFEAWVQESLGMRLNAYDLRTNEGTFAPLKVFLKKDKQTGKTAYLTKEKAWVKYLAAHAQQ